MTLTITHTHRAPRALAPPLLWTCFIGYLVLAGYAMACHEPWGDEIHSWNIVKGSGSFPDLIRNIRYEGHPPLWYITMWPVSKLTHHYEFVQLVHLLIASCTVFLVLFYAPYSIVTRLLIPFGYYFLYEYAVLSRNYAIGVLLAFCICLVLRKEFLYKRVVYYGLLFLLSNAHLLCLLLAVSLQVYHLLLYWQQHRKLWRVGWQAVVGAMVLLPAVYFIFPPADSALNTGFWMDKWEASQFVLTAQAPWRAFVPIPAWWSEHSWNTNFLLALHSRLPFLKWISPLLSLSIVALLCWMMRRDKKSLALFITNLALTFFISVVVFPVTWGRYVGFIFIGFLVAYWLFNAETATPKKYNRLVYALLVAQLVAGVLSVAKDVRRPFSQLPRVNELLQKVPAQARTVTDYWALNAIAAFADRPFYCVDLQKEVSFLLWDKDQAVMQKKPHRYTDGLQHLFEKERLTSVYFVTLHAPDVLVKQDSLLAGTFRIRLVDQITGSIEKDCNLYLYEMSK